MANKSVTVGILLAAGHSRRFGATNKLLTTFRDKPLILHAADTMKGAGLDHCIAVVSNEKVAEELSDFLLVKINSTDQSNSLINGLKKARKLNANRLVIMLADMPFITPKIVKSVVERCDEHTPAAASDGQRRMPPVCFPKSFFERLAAIEGDFGAKAILKDIPENSTITVKENYLRDIDILTDLKM